jgi:hypothetical protein
VTGGFVSVDPLVAVTGQAYAYAWGSPVNVTDPAGLEGNSEEVGDAEPGEVDALYALSMEQVAAGDDNAQANTLASEAGDPEECAKDVAEQSGGLSAPDASPDFTDPSVSPGSDWQWRGSGNPGSKQGSWYNPSTGESLHPDLDHPAPIGAHYDWKTSTGQSFRVYANGTVISK